MIGHLLNRRLDVYRPATEPDSGGGQKITRHKTGTVRARVSAPSPSEHEIAGRHESEVNRDVYLSPGADVARGDELRGGGEVLEVTATVAPSEPVYLKAVCVSRQAEG